MTIVKRLLLLVGAALISLLAMTAVNYVQMNRVYDAANFGNINVVPSIEVLNKVAVEFGRLRVRVYRHVMNTDEKAMQEVEATIMAGREHVRKFFKDYEPLIADDEDRRLLEAERASFDRYNKNIDEVLDVPGIDAVAIGPNDLSGTVGVLRQHDHPKVKSSIERIIAAAKARGLAATMGIVTPPEQTAELARKGVRLVLVAADVGLLVKGYDVALATARGVAVDGAAIEKAAEA